MILSKKSKNICTSFKNACKSFIIIQLERDNISTFLYLNEWCIVIQPCLSFPLKISNRNSRYIPYVCFLAEPVFFILAKAIYHSKIKNKAFDNMRYFCLPLAMEKCLPFELPLVILSLTFVKAKRSEIFLENPLPQKRPKFLTDLCPSF